MRLTTYFVRPVLILGAALAFAIMPPAFAWPSTYSAPEIRARVVDEKTGEPLGGAVVNARWVLLTELVGGNSHYLHNVHEFETSTDQDGRFLIPAWGPRLHEPNSHLVESVPEFRVFKSGYLGWRFHNDRRVKPDLSVVESDWNGKTMTLHPFDGDWKTYVRSINSMWSGSNLDDCFRSCPRMVLAVYAEWDRIKPLVPPDLYRREAHPPPFRTLPLNDQEFLEQFRQAHGK
jgi:hypothetical protein